MNRFDIIVIGGGASGIFSAVTAGRLGKKVAVIEKNRRIGRKLAITGKGRCNVTNDCNDVGELMANIPVNPRFLYSAFSSCMPQDIIDFFEKDCGVALKTERGNRVFPVSDKAEDIVKALEKSANKAGVKIFLSKAVTELIIDERDGRKVCCGVRCGKEEFYAESVIVATGGMSYPLTGSTGDGYRFAESAGHKVTELSPSLVPIVTEEKYCKDMMGLSLKNVTLSLFSDKKLVSKEMGEMLFTHFGVSGPLVLSASSLIREPEKHKYTMKIDLKPALTPEQLDARLQRDFSENINKDFINSLNKLLPSVMIPVVVKLSGIPQNLKVNQISKQQRLNLAELLKNFPLTVKEFRPIEEAIITSGGISVREIEPKTMKSKLVEGLYFAGEVIDVDAYTGGFNLQIAFATGFTAGQNA